LEEMRRRQEESEKLKRDDALKMLMEINRKRRELEEAKRN